MTRRWARSTKTIKAMTATDHGDHQRHAGTMPATSAPVRLSSKGTCARASRQIGDDAGENDERDAVADAARGDLLAEPHQEDDAAGDRRHGREAEEEAGIEDRAAR